jgi:hypothetical protein
MVPGSNCDDCSNNVALPFPFDFYGTTFNSVNAISNGSLQFSSANATFTNVCPLPVVGFNNTIFAYWDDLLLISAGQGIFTSTSGVAPNRIFNVEWRAGYFSGGGSANFEIRLYETTNQIEFIYGTVTQGIASATGGLQRGTGPTVEPLFCNGSGQAITSGLTVLYTCVATGCTLTCPANVTQGNDPAQCGAAVTLPPTGGTCTNATCAPPSGSFFPVGTTTVTCSDPAAPAPCSFTVTVDDLEPPVLVCPADIVEDLAPGETEGVASWADPGVSDNCPGVGSPTCVPPSGSLFPAGTTPVDCSATDAAGNSGACSFNVTLNLVSILEIPTASTWGLAALALLLAAAAFFALRRTA